MKGRIAASFIRKPSPDLPRHHQPTRAVALLHLFDSITDFHGLFMIKSLQRDWRVMTR